MMEHLSKDTIIAYIDNKLAEFKAKQVKKHLEECDKCFLIYADLKSSVLEIEQEKLTTPEEFKKKAQKNWGFTEKEPISNGVIHQKKKWFKELSQFFFGRNNRILVPVAATLLLITITIIFINPKRPSEKKSLSPIITKKDTYKKMIAKTDKAKLPDNLIRGEKKMPNFAGMPKEVIIDILEGMKVNYELKYSKKGFKQNPKAGEVIAESDTVIVFLKH